MSRISPIRSREDARVSDLHKSSSSPSRVSMALAYSSPVIWSGKQHSHNPFAFLTVVNGVSYYINKRCCASFDVAGLTLLFLDCVIVFVLSTHLTNQECIPGTNC